MHRALATSHPPPRAIPRPNTSHAACNRSRSFREARDLLRPKRPSGITWAWLWFQVLHALRSSHPASICHPEQCARERARESKLSRSAGVRARRRNPERSRGSSEGPTPITPSIQHQGVLTKLSTAPPPKTYASRSHPILRTTTNKRVEREPAWPRPEGWVIM